MVSTISKDKIAELPVAKFEGRIEIINTEEEAIRAVSYLSGFNTIGFDTETRPSFKKGVKNKIALMQLATEEVCFLFRLNLLGFPDCIIDLLTNPNIIKVGLSLRDDFSAIRKRTPFLPQRFIELQAFVKKYGILDNGLQRIYAIIFGQKISKRQRLTNWEAAELSEAQQMYAALDAWSCLKIYNKLIEEERKDK